MADQNDSGPLVEAARSIGSTIVKMVSAVSGTQSDASDAPKEGKHAPWSVEQLGSGTFIIHKPKRKKHKLRQSRLHGRRPGMRA